MEISFKSSTGTAVKAVPTKKCPVVNEEMSAGYGDIDVRGWEFRMSDFYY